MSQLSQASSSSSSRAREFQNFARSSQSKPTSQASITLPVEREGFISFAARIGNEIITGYLPADTPIMATMIATQVMGSTIGPILTLQTAMEAGDKHLTKEASEKLYTAVHNEVFPEVPLTSIDPNKSRAVSTAIHRWRKIQNLLLSEEESLDGPSKLLVTRIIASAEAVVKNIVSRKFSDNEIAAEYKLPVYYLRTLFGDKPIDINQPGLFKRLHQQKLGKGFGFTMLELTQLEKYSDLVSPNGLRTPTELEKEMWNQLIPKLMPNKVDDPTAYAKMLKVIFPFVLGSEIRTHFNSPENTLLVPLELPKMTMENLLPVWTGTQNCMYYVVQQKKSVKTLLSTLLGVVPAPERFIDKKTREVFFDQNAPLIVGSNAQFHRIAIREGLPTGVLPEIDNLILVAERALEKTPEGQIKIVLEPAVLKPAETEPVKFAFPQLDKIIEDARKAAALAKKNAKKTSLQNPNSSLTVQMIKDLKADLDELRGLTQEAKADVILSVLNLKPSVAEIGLKRLRAKISQYFVTGLFADEPNPEDIVETLEDLF